VRQISPDGRFISFPQAQRHANIWVKVAEETIPRRTARQRRSDPAHPRYFWSRIRSTPLLRKDSSGRRQNFNKHFYAIDPTRGGGCRPDDRRAAERAPHRSQGRAHWKSSSVPRAKPDILYMRLNDRDPPRWHDLYELHISTGREDFAAQDNENISVGSSIRKTTACCGCGAKQLRGATKPEILRVDAGASKDKLRLYVCSIPADIYGFDAAPQCLPDHQQGAVGSHRTGTAQRGERVPPRR